jgi:hypothetical protein
MKKLLINCSFVYFPGGHVIRKENFALILDVDSDTTSLEPLIIKKLAELNYKNADHVRFSAQSF